MTALLEDLTTFFSWCTLRIADVFSTIVNNPVLLIITVGFLIVGFTVGLASRFFRIN